MAFKHKEINDELFIITHTIGVFKEYKIVDKFRYESEHSTAYLLCTNDGWMNTVSISDDCENYCMVQIGDDIICVDKQHTIDELNHLHEFFTQTLKNIEDSITQLNKED